MASKFAKMNAAELLEYCKALYQEKGLKALTYPELKKTKGLYWSLYSKGLNQRELINKLGLEKEYKGQKGRYFSKRYGDEVREGWTWDRVLLITREIIEKEGFLPPAAWFQNNGHASLVQFVYYSGNTWENLRDAVGDFSNSSFVESRNGIRWRSHPEASLSNFLYARGIEHKRGEKYPDEFSKTAKQSYGYYDLHFKDKDNLWVSVEIWGEKPNGASAKRYLKKRIDKETFNKSLGDSFLGIEFRDCFDEEKLTQILSKYVGEIEPYIFEKPHDRIVQTSHWSNADELIVTCRQIAEQQPDGIFPTEEWLRKRGKHKDREGEIYNTIAIYIRLWLGGVRNLRKILGQGHGSTTSWDKDSALKAYADFFSEYGAKPGTVSTMFQRGKGSYKREDYRKATRIVHAVNKYVGSVQEVHKILGIPYK